jgi:hypothetical protein
MKDNSPGINCLTKAIIQEIYHQILGGILESGGISIPKIG